MLLLVIVSIFVIRSAAESILSCVLYITSIHAAASSPYHRNPNREIDFNSLQRTVILARKRETRERIIRICILDKDQTARRANSRRSIMTVAKSF